ncbi:hypothetical protein CCACVL1_21738 [Corchorus capsularis]|uniref:Uncharacterized protein n=1 Tax=Corchorus capsularis TaxID=210143 RepID=A0A1R3H2F1_COCAP|nr:hypothetical protein CCACVL1_21738 [Corchorus capsularis]
MAFVSTKVPAKLTLWKVVLPNVLTVPQIPPLSNLPLPKTSLGTGHWAVCSHGVFASFLPAPINPPMQ